MKQWDTSKNGAQRLMSKEEKRSEKKDKPPCSCAPASDKCFKMKSVDTNLMWMKRKKRKKRKLNMNEGHIQRRCRIA